MDLDQFTHQYDHLSTDIEALKRAISNKLMYQVGKNLESALPEDWLHAVAYAVRDHLVERWMKTTRASYAQDVKRVYYLSMEFLIGRLLEDATANLGLTETVETAMASLGQDFRSLAADEPDAALGNGGLGRLAACFMESMATLGCPAYGYGIRYEHGLFRQRFEGGRQAEAPEDWLSQTNPWEFPRPESAYTIPFKGHVETVQGRDTWIPAETVMAEAHDTPVIGWQGKWANTLRLWAAKPTTLLDLDRFNRGDYAAAAEPEALARTLSRVLYPDDTTYQGKELRLKQEFFLTSATLQDILRRYLADHSDLAALPAHVAIQMNDTHPAIAGPELIRLLSDVHGMAFDDALQTARACLGYTNHTLLPEALEAWPTFTFGNVLPRHMQIVERIDSWHRRTYPNRPHRVGIVRQNQVHMGELAFVMAHKVNGVSALHSDLVKRDLFPDLHRLHPDRIVNQTNGVTPRRWLKTCNRPLSALITRTIGPDWEADLDRLKLLEPQCDDAAFLADFAAAKRQNKVALSNWLGAETGLSVSPDAMFDVQIKRIHEYKRQLLNILDCIAHWHALRSGTVTNPVPRLRIFGGKAAPGYAMAKDIIRLINDVAAVVNVDSQVGDLLKIIYPANYNVSMAERLIPASDLSEQISTAGKEASGTGNMKFQLNGALTIGTLDGANVEIREEVGADNFFLFGKTVEEVDATWKAGYNPWDIYQNNASIRRVLDAIKNNFFNLDQPGLYQPIWDTLLVHGDRYLVLDEFDAYVKGQAKVSEAFEDQARWAKMCILNIANSGKFSTDRTIAEYAQDIWNIHPCPINGD